MLVGAILAGGRVINSRFGFAFSYPRAWGRRTATNNDGHTVLHPTIEGISINGWGTARPCLGECRHLTYRSEWISRHLSVRGFDCRPNSADITKMIEGEREIFDDTESRFMQVHVEHNDLEIKVRCRAPIRYFDEFEATFLTACHSLAFFEE